MGSRTAAFGKVRDRFPEIARRLPALGLAAAVFAVRCTRQPLTATTAWADPNAEHYGAEEPLVCMTPRWRERDSNHQYRGTKSADFRGIRAIDKAGRARIFRYCGEVRSILCRGFGPPVLLLPTGNVGRKLDGAL